MDSFREDAYRLVSGCDSANFIPFIYFLSGGVSNFFYLENVKSFKVLLLRSMVLAVIFWEDEFGNIIEIE
jgi:hypothetical protein